MSKDHDIITIGRSYAAHSADGYVVEPTVDLFVWEGEQWGSEHRIIHMDPDSARSLARVIAGAADEVEKLAAAEVDGSPCPAMDAHLNCVDVSSEEALDASIERLLDRGWEVETLRLIGSKCTDAADEAEEHKEGR